MNPALGDNRYGVLFVDDDEAVVEAMPEEKSYVKTEPATKPAKKKKEKKLPGTDDKIESLVIDNKEFNRSMNFHRREQRQRELKVILEDYHERTFHTRNFRQSNTYGNRRYMPNKERDDYNQPQVQPLQEHEQVEQQPMQLQPAQDTGNNNNNNTNDTSNKDASVDDEMTYITIDEYAAMRVERAKPVYNIRQPGEGEVVRPEWQQMTVLPKKKKNKPLKGNGGGNGLGLGYDATMYPQRWRRQQRIDIEFKFNDEGRRSNGRRFGRQRNNNNSNRDEHHINHCNTIDVQDIAAFPSLG